MKLETGWSAGALNKNGKRGMVPFKVGAGRVFECMKRRLTFQSKHAFTKELLSNRRSKIRTLPVFKKAGTSH
jgi:hypothetical protein